MISSMLCSLSQMSWNGSEQLERAMEEVLDDAGDGPGPPEEAGGREVSAAPSSQIRPPSLTLDTSPHGRLLLNQLQQVYISFC